MTRTMKSEPDRRVRLEAASTTVTLSLDLPESAALVASLAALWPSVSDSAASAMRKLSQALHPDATSRSSRHPA